jgi:dTDP-4-amino-4,6-dideoxygalactose transaminase
MKEINNPEDLAINGAKPMFDKQLYVGYPNVGNKEQYFQMMNNVFERNWLTNNGYYVKEFEKKLCDYLGVKYAIPVCNATIGLEIATKALGMKGEVIVPSFTFVATAHILQWQGIKPIFIDVDPQTHTIDVTKVEELITPQTTGILGVHLWGNPCNIQKLSEIAEKYHLKLMFDSAHAFGCSYQGKKIGNFGECEVFSFHATKIFNSFEGGAITTNNEQLAMQLRQMINFGFSGYDSVDNVGLNGKMCESSAVMGIVNLEAMPKFIASTKHNYDLFKKYLADIRGIKLIEYNEKEDNNYHYIVLEIDEEQYGISRDDIYNILHSENIIARRYFYPGCHRMEPYNTLYKEAVEYLTVTEELSNKVLVLPNNTNFNKTIVKAICYIIRQNSIFCRENNSIK